MRKDSIFTEDQLRASILNSLSDVSLQLEKLKPFYLLFCTMQKSSNPQKILFLIEDIDSYISAINHNRKFYNIETLNSLIYSISILLIQFHEDKYTEHASLVKNLKFCYLLMCSAFFKTYELSTRQPG